jgi:HPt (histidine-containing phosphotransfer) domain-containing protein
VAVPAPAGELLRSAYRDDPDMTALIADFVAGQPATVAQLERLLTDRDIDALRRSVHQLKGAGGGYGFAPITRLATEAERWLDARAGPDAVAAQVNGLIALIRQVEGFPMTRPHAQR